MLGLYPETVVVAFAPIISSEFSSKETSSSSTTEEDATGDKLLVDIIPIPNADDNIKRLAIM